MRRSIIRRVLQFIPVLLGITFLAFLLIYLSPSDPVSVRMSAGGISVSPEIMESMRRSMGLDRPLLIQYGDWLWNILHGNMGKSYITDADVLDQILKALPYTLKMAGASLLLTLCISIPVGILTAAMQNSKFDYVVRVMAFVGNALPNFIIALCLMFIFSYRLGWIPVLATTKPIGLILPALTLALVMSSRYIRQIRAAMLDELGKGYVVGLRSRGLSETTILYKNVLKNIMVTVITLTGISLGSLLGGTVIVETVFTWPGLGNLIMEGISQRDYPVVQAVIVWMASAFMVVNLLTDISYTGDRCISRVSRYPSGYCRGGYFRRKSFKCHVRPCANGVDPVCPAGTELDPCY